MKHGKDAGSVPFPAASLIQCPQCAIEMRLVGIEAERAGSRPIHFRMPHMPLRRGPRGQHGLVERQQPTWPAP